MQGVSQDILEFCEDAADSFEVSDDPSVSVGDTIDRFFCHIEKYADYFNGYRILCKGHDQKVLNQQIGKWVKEHYGFVSDGESAEHKSSLIESYTILLRPVYPAQSPSAPTSAGKPGAKP